MEEAPVGTSSNQSPVNAGQPSPQAELSNSTDTPATADSPYSHDVFISYSRKDVMFAQALERALKNYTPPKGLGAPPRPLRVFRDQSDLTGVEYHQSIARHLAGSRKLLAMCSPRSRASQFVNEEISRFAAARGAENIVPLLVDGLPNNEALPEQEEQKAFPDALCAAMQMPLAADYRQFDFRRDKLNKGTFYASWYTMLANLLDRSRSDIEQRDRKREARRRKITIGTVSGVMTLLAVAFVITLFAQREAVRQRDQAEHRRLVALTQLVASRAMEQATNGTEMWAKLLARQAWLFNERVHGDALAQVDAGLRAVAKDSSTTMSLNADELVTSSAVNRQRTLLASGTAKDIKVWDLTKPGSSPRMLRGHRIDVVALAFSPKGNTLASGSWDETVRVWNLAENEPTSRALRGHIAYVTTLAFSPDGEELASGSDDGTVRLWKVVDLGSDPLILRAPDGAVKSIAFSADGKTLVAGTSLGRVLLWDRSARVGAPPRVLVGGDDEVKSVALSREGNQLAAAIGYSVAIWDLTGNVTEPRILTFDDSISRLAFSPDGALLAIARFQADLHLRQLANLEAAPVILARPTGTDSLEYDAEGARLVAIGRNPVTGDTKVNLQTWRVPTQALAEDMCGKGVISNLPAVAWQELIGPDVPYERTCDRHEVHPDYYVWVERLATDGEPDRALAALRRADELDRPGEEPRDHLPEVNRLTAKGLINRGTAMAGNGDVDGAAALFRRAMTLDTSLKIEPDSLARKTRAPRVAADAENRAREGDYAAALALFTEAKNMDPSLDIDPAQRAAEYSAPGLVHKGVRLSYRGEVKQAIAAFARAQQLKPDLEIESESWNEICWNGSLWGYAAEVMFACDRAVELDESAGSLDSRGLARALVGNRAGALEDFREFIDLARFREGLDNEIAQRTSWIAALERGENPLTKEVLMELRSKL